MSSGGKGQTTANTSISIINQWEKVEGITQGLTIILSFLGSDGIFWVFLFFWSSRMCIYHIIVFIVCLVGLLLFVVLFCFYKLNGTIKDFLTVWFFLSIYYLYALTNCVPRAVLEDLECCDMQPRVAMNYTVLWRVDCGRLELLHRQQQTQRHRCPG